MSAGLGTSVLAGQSSPGQAQTVIDYRLHCLFPGIAAGVTPNAQSSSRL